VTTVQLAAMRRTTIAEEDRVDFAVYLDEFHNWTTDTFASILAEARKYRLSLTLGHQYLAQVSPAIRAAVFGNVGTLVAFQVGYDDAEALAGEFMPYAPEVLTGFSRGEVAVRTIADGTTSAPFLGSTIAEVGWSYASREKVIGQSRRRYGTPREEVEAAIGRWMAKSNLHIRPLAS
jgi:hypothetical protein